MGRVVTIARPGMINRQSSCEVSLCLQSADLFQLLSIEYFPGILTPEETIPGRKTERTRHSFSDRAKLFCHAAGQQPLLFSSCFKQRKRRNVRLLSCVLLVVVFRCRVCSCQIGLA